MANTVTNVTAGKPKVAGAVFRAPLGTTLPTDATTNLASAFVAMGYCSEDGVTNSNSPDSSDIKAWGGDTVLNIQESKDDTFQFTLLEVLNPDVLKAVYGDDNVTGTLTGTSGIAVTANSKEVGGAVWAIDMVMREDAVKRIIIPNGKVSEIGDIVYSDSEAVGYEITITAMPDTAGNTHYEYIKRAAATSSH